MKEILYFVGPTLKLRNNVGGATIKNQNLVNYFNSQNYKIELIDTDNWKSRVGIIILRLIKMFLSPNKRKIILSTSSGGTYFFLKLNYYLNIFKKDIYYFVVGGDTPSKIEDGIFNIKYYKKCKKIFIETNSMKDKMLNFELFQTTYLPNFKKFRKRIVTNKENKLPLKTVFFSRITPEKGVDMIFEMQKIINKDILKIEIDFYGPISDDYEKEFKSKILENNLINYKGILNAQDESTYDILEQYDLMLFPTYWKGEGFPGTIIDSFISGVPILASDWKYNKEIIKDNITGFLFETKNQTEFEAKIKYILENPSILKTMRINCYKESEKYKVENVLKNIFTENS